MNKKKDDQRSKQVGIWIRVSTEDQAHSDSPEHHEQRARWYAESKDWKIIDVYHLEAVSGKSVMDHPETKRMLEDVKDGRISGLIFSKLARLARNTKELLEFADYFKEYNADLISLQESIDTSTPVGRLFYTMIAAMAQWEREEIADRVAASVPIRAKLGKPLGGKAPFGFQWKEDKCIPHPDEAPICRRIYEMFLEEKRVRTVTRILNETGIRTTGGGQFCSRTIKRILSNPIYKGVRRANYTKSRGDGKCWDYKSQKDWVLIEVEPVVSEDVWDECNRMLCERAEKYKPPSKKTRYLFAGFAYCSCGEKMYVISGGVKYVCQKCRNKIPVVDLDGVYYEQLRGFFFSATDIEKHLRTADNNIKEKEELLVVLLREQKKIAQEMDKTYRLYLDDQLTSAGFGTLHKPLEKRYHQLDEEIPKLQGELDYLKINFLASDQIINEARDLYSRWPKLAFKEKREIVENITDRIVIGKDDITINLCYLPSPIPSKILANGLRNR